MAMRLISQDCQYDVPYDQTILIRDGTFILAQVVGFETQIVMAAYATEKDAIDVLKRIHSHYSRMDVGAIRFAEQKLPIKALDEEFA